MKKQYSVQFYRNSSSEYRTYTCKAKAFQDMRGFIKRERVLHSKNKGFIKTITPTSISLDHVIYASVFTLLTDTTKL